jgi:beta-N-acetylhexosaminidase
MKLLKLGTIPIIIFTLFIIIGCNLSISNYGKEADIRGSITSIYQATEDSTGDVIGSILIEGNIEKDTEYDKASVTITKETRIFESKSGKLIKANFDSLKPNQRVQALFTGPVAESYPVQVRAKEVVILE